MIHLGRTSNTASREFTGHAHGPEALGRAASSLERGSPLRRGGDSHLKGAQVGDDGAGLRQGVELSPVEALIAEARVGGLDVAILLLPKIESRLHHDDGYPF